MFIGNLAPTDHNQFPEPRMILFSDTDTSSDPNVWITQSIYGQNIWMCYRCSVIVKVHACYNARRLKVQDPEDMLYLNTVSLGKIKLFCR